MRRAVVVDVVRSPFARGRPGGALEGVHPVDLYAQTLQALVRRTGVDPGLIEDVITGCVIQIGEQSGNIGRQAVLAAGLPERVPAVTLDRKCGSAQQANHLVAGLIAAARQAGISCQDYQLPRDLPATPLLAGLSGDEIASLIVEVLHADDANATAAGRATDLMILRKITRALGGDVTMTRLHEALSLLLADAADPAAADDQATADGATNAAGPAAGTLSPICTRPIFRRSRNRSA